MFRTEKKSSRRKQKMNLISLIFLLFGLCEAIPNPGGIRVQLPDAPITINMERQKIRVESPVPKMKAPTARFGQPKAGQGLPKARFELPKPRFEPTKAAVQPPMAMVEPPMNSQFESKQGNFFYIGQRKEIFHVVEMSE